MVSFDISFTQNAIPFGKIVHANFAFQFTGIFEPQRFGLPNNCTISLKRSMHSESLAPLRKCGFIVFDCDFLIRVELSIDDFVA